MRHGLPGDMGSLRSEESHRRPGSSDYRLRICVQYPIALQSSLGLQSTYASASGCSGTTREDWSFDRRPLRVKWPCGSGTEGNAGHSWEAFEGGKKPFNVGWMDTYTTYGAGWSNASWVSHTAGPSCKYAHARPCWPRTRWPERPILVFDRRRVGAKWDEEVFGMRQAGCADGAEAHREGTVRGGIARRTIRA